jgi:hypothetical protein
MAHQQMQLAADGGGRLIHSPLLPIMPVTGWFVGLLVGGPLSLNQLVCLMLGSLKQPTVFTM